MYFKCYTYFSVGDGSLLTSVEGAGLLLEAALYLPEELLGSSNRNIPFHVRAFIVKDSKAEFLHLIE